MQGKLSGDRIWQEFSKILQTGSVGIRMMDELGFLKTLFPEVTALKGLNHGQWHQEGDPFVHTLMVIDRYLERDNNPIVLFALLLHDIGKVSPMPNRGTYPMAKYNTGKFYGHEEVSAQMAESIVSRVIGKEFSAKDAETVVWLVAQHMRGGRVQGTKRSAMFSDARFPMLLEVLRADQLGRVPQSHDWEKTSEAFENHKNTFTPVNGDEVSLKNLNVNGHTVMKALNLTPGKRLGALLSQAQDYLWENPTASHDDVMAHLTVISLSQE